MLPVKEFCASNAAIKKGLQDFSYSPSSSVLSDAIRK